jgi:hypothetical protein
MWLMFFVALIMAAAGYEQKPVWWPAVAAIACGVVITLIGKGPANEWAIAMMVIAALCFIPYGVGRAIKSAKA